MGKKKQRNLLGIARFVKTLEPTSKSPAEQTLQAGELDLVQPEAEEVVAPFPSKRRKLDFLGEIKEDDTLRNIPRYTSIEEVPPQLEKYFAQRHRFFSRYDEGCLLDEEGWYSVTPEKVADQIAERCRCDTILDAFCGVGGNAIAFAKTCHNVIALDISPVRLAIARHNAKIYGVEDRIEFILMDYLDFARIYPSERAQRRPIDVVFLSPPWGGPSYMSMSPQKELDETEVPFQSDYSLKNITPVPGDELFHISRRISHNIAYFLPRNVNLLEVSQLVTQDTTLPDQDLVTTQRVTSEELVEVEEEYMGGKLKAVTCYFGGLVEGQQDMF